MAYELSHIFIFIILCFNLISYPRPNVKLVKVPVSTREGSEFLCVYVRADVYIVLVMFKENIPLLEN